MKKGFLTSSPKKKASPTATAPPCPPPAAADKGHAAPPPASAEMATAKPFLSDRVERLVDSSSSGVLKAVSTSEEGRSVVLARGAHAPGTVVMRAECYATVVAEDDDQHCSRCLSEGCKARCIGCGSKFCSDECLQDAGAEHAAECFALSRLRSTTLKATDPETARLALRCLARRGVEAPPAPGDLHFRDVEDLMSHRKAEA
eukprot:CAMPEP_0114138846 /NCGR_PEP_ID=MMETSP0043_2-20121206/16544_1 /TAXON_ID=464988 /ORGANISM="Hemiselmis andersenii, Strain CCMP644" /LENGTH=201 /DNA_ID=CAMNT_0001232851 /DNA_START=21 /DNA_END=622 /DNA_ORIENTATION=-